MARKSPSSSLCLEKTHFSPALLVSPSSSRVSKVMQALHRPGLHRTPDAELWLDRMADLQNQSSANGTELSRFSNLEDINLLADGTLELRVMISIVYSVVCAGSGGQPAGLLPHESPAGEEEIHDQLLHHEPGGHGLPVRPHAALLGRGHGAGFHLAVWTRHVQGGGHGDRDERVRERILPHRYECDALLVSCVRAQGPNAQQALLGEAGQRASVAPSHCCVGSHGDLLTVSSINGVKLCLLRFPTASTGTLCITCRRSLWRLCFRCSSPSCVTFSCCASFACGAWTTTSPSAGPESPNPSRSWSCPSSYAGCPTTPSPSGESWSSLTWSTGTKSTTRSTRTCSRSPFVWRTQTAAWIRSCIASCAGSSGKCSRTSSGGFRRPRSPTAVRSARSREPWKSATAAMRRFLWTWWRPMSTDCRWWTGKPTRYRPRTRDRDKRAKPCVKARCLLEISTGGLSANSTRMSFDLFIILSSDVSRCCILKRLCQIVFCKPRVRFKPQCFFNASVHVSEFKRVVLFRVNVRGDADLDAQSIELSK